jgi:hypothetical protein
MFLHEEMWNHNPYASKALIIIIIIPSTKVMVREHCLHNTNNVLISDCVLFLIITAEESGFESW